VRMRRHKLDLSQTQLADALGVTFQQIQSTKRARTASAPADFSK
jgi:transcriptional regulator with XRE-family HTH domain